MKRFFAHVGLATSLGVGLTLAFIGLMSTLGSGRPIAHAAGHTVCPAGPPTCTFTNIQAVVDAAAEGDVIKVAAGTYTGVNSYGGLAQVVYISKTVTLRGGYSATGSQPVVTLLPQGCEAYPIALPPNKVSGLQPGETTGPILRGSNAEEFSWLRWNPEPGHNNVTYLIEELDTPSLSMHDFTNAMDSTDHSLSAGDWVSSLEGMLNSNDLQDSLHTLKSDGITLRVPVWNNTTGSGLDRAYQQERFILVKLIGFNLISSLQSLRFIYVGEADDPETCRNFGLSLTPHQAQTQQPGRVATYTHSLRNQGHYTETAVLTYSTTLTGWPVQLSPLSQSVGPGQLATVTAVVSVPLGSQDGLTHVTSITASLVASPAVSSSVVDTTTVGTAAPEGRTFLPVIVKE